MQHYYDTALVLEGGGLRGVFTCGALDCFMDHGIRFPHVLQNRACGFHFAVEQKGRYTP